jgi:actin-like ATPase involved in cell morphogenesis
MSNKSREAIIGFPKPITISSLEVNKAVSSSIEASPIALEKAFSELPFDILDCRIIRASDDSMIGKVDLVDPFDQLPA